jgi:hypothetical protein
VTALPEIVAGYSITGAVLAGYAVWVVVRTRRLKRDHDTPS